MIFVVGVFGRKKTVGEIQRSVLVNQTREIYSEDVSKTQRRVNEFN
jgi:hypothetical protein